MTDREATYLRRIQDKLLNLAYVQSFIQDWGDTQPLWEGGPSAEEMRSFVYPEWKSRVENYLKDTVRICADCGCNIKQSTAYLYVFLSPDRGTCGTAWSCPECHEEREKRKRTLYWDALTQ